jgi:V-type H+-transporting ATPase proteolipid subunit
VAVILTGTDKPATIMKSLLPVIMAGILTIYGLLIGMYIALMLDGSKPVSFYSASLHLCSGLMVGTASLSAGFTIGRLGDACVRAFVREPRLFTAMILLLVCGEILGMYGLVCSMMIVTYSKKGLYC